MTGPGGATTPAPTVELSPLADDLVRVEETLRGAVRTADPFLADVAAHLIAAGGKRIRPTLALCATYASSSATRASDDAVTGAVAVELVHLGSLYHDDVIDEAETRRGVPSVNARWSNIVAILAGDFLLARASSLAASLGADVAGAPGLDDRRAVPRAGPRAAAPLRHRPAARTATSRRSKARPRRCSRRRAGSAAWSRRCPTPRSTR